MGHRRVDSYSSAIVAMCISTQVSLHGNDGVFNQTTCNRLVQKDWEKTINFWINNRHASTNSRSLRVLNTPINVHANACGGSQQRSLHAVSQMPYLDQVRQCTSRQMNMDRSKLQKEWQRRSTLINLMDNAICFNASFPSHVESRALHGMEPGADKFSGILLRYVPRIFRVMTSPALQDFIEPCFL